MKILYKPVLFDGVWKVRAENLEEGATLRKICLGHDVSNCEFAVKTVPLIEAGLLKDEKSPPVQTTWEIRTKEANIFLASRYDKEAAEVCAKDFGQWWPGGCIVIPPDEVQSE